MIPFGPDQESVDAIKEAAYGGIKKGTKELRKSADGAYKTPKQVADNAAVTAPADKLAFLDSLKTAPTTWSSAILESLNLLFDDDLAALVVALPRRAPSQVDFETWIDSLLGRYETQVLAVNKAVRPIAVVTKDLTVRRALVTEEQTFDNSLRGEARFAPRATGKMRLMRWVDGDMVVMAQERAREHDASRVFEETHRFDEADYWDAASLDALASDKPPAAPQSSPLVSSAR